MKIKTLLVSTVLCASAQASGPLAELAMYAVRPLGRLVGSFPGYSPLITVPMGNFFSTNTRKSYTAVKVKKPAVKIEKNNTSKAPLSSTTEPVLSDLEIRKKMDDFSEALKKARVNCFPTVAEEFPKLDGLLARIGCTFGFFERYKNKEKIDLFLESTSYRDFRLDERDWLFERKKIEETFKDLSPDVRSSVESIDKMFRDIVELIEVAP
jgi:hypothetical protein